MGEFRCPLLQVRPEQIAQFADFLLGVEFGAQIHEVQEGPQAETHHKVLAVIKGHDAPGMFLGEACLEKIAVAGSGLLAKLQILLAHVCAVVILLALAIAVIPHRA